MNFDVFNIVRSFITAQFQIFLCCLITKLNAFDMFWPRFEFVANGVYELREFSLIKRTKLSSQIIYVDAGIGCFLLFWCLAWNSV